MEQHRPPLQALGVGIRSTVSPWAHETSSTSLPETAERGCSSVIFEPGRA